VSAEALELSEGKLQIEQIEVRHKLVFTILNPPSADSPSSPDVDLKNGDAAWRNGPDRDK
jgi:hypothetical protein